MSNILAGTYIDMLLLYTYLHFEIAMCFVSTVSIFGFVDEHMSWCGEL